MKTKINKYIYIYIYINYNYIKLYIIVTTLTTLIKYKKIKYNILPFKIISKY